MESAPRMDQWKLFYSTMVPGSFGYEALGAAVPLSEVPCDFAAPGRSGAAMLVQPRHHRGRSHQHRREVPTPRSMRNQRRLL